MNRVKTKLQKGEVTIGSWIQLPNPSVAHIMGMAGYDWAAFDLEHGLISPEILPALCHALVLGGTVPFARVAQARSKDIKQALEAGCQGLIFPMIQSRQELEKAISWSCYPPYGTRGVGYSEANLFGKEFDRCVPDSVLDMVFVAQIENTAALESIEEILSVERLDAIIVGPYDLSASMGLTARFDHPDFLAAMDRIESAAKAAGIPMGTHIVQPAPEMLRQRIEDGHRFIAYGVDTVFLWRGAQRPESE